MKNEIYCGSSCVKYILEKYNKDITNLKKDMLWTTELAICLKQNGINNQIYCFNSRLYSDFLNNKFDSNFDGFKYLIEAQKNNVSIREKNITIDSLKEEIDSCKYIILCVESSIFNNDASMSGGHYIIISGRNNNVANIINPIKEKYEFKNLNINFLIDACKNYGAWRIIIKEKKI